MKTPDVPQELRAAYKKTSLYAFRRLGKASRVLWMYLSRFLRVESVVGWLNAKLEAAYEKAIAVIEKAEGRTP